MSERPTGFANCRYELIFVEPLTFRGEWFPAGRRITVGPDIAQQLIASGKVWLLRVFGCELWPSEKPADDNFSPERMARFHEDFAAVEQYRRSLSVRADPKPVNWRDWQP